MSIVFPNCIFSSSDMHGCGWIRSYLPAKYLNGKFMGGFDPKWNFDTTQYIFFQRHSHPDFVGFIEGFQEKGIKCFYDIDDDIWTIDETNPAKKAFCEKTLLNIEKIISKCDGVVTSTIPLRDVIKSKCHDDVYVVPNLVEVPTAKKQEHQKIVIGYAGSTSHKGDFSKSLIYSLEKLYKKYRGKLEYVFVGYIPEELKPYSHYISGIEAQHYLNSINYFSFDISLIPLKDTVFNKSKSNLKWLDYSICGSCSVASDTYCYQEIDHGVTGFNIYDDKWFDTLEELINNELLRKEVALNSFNHVLKEYSWINARKKQIDIYNELSSN